MDDVQEHRDPRDETRIEVTADVSRLIARSLNVTNIDKGMLGTESGAMVIDEYTDLRQRLIDDATRGRQSDQDTARLEARVEHLEYALGMYDASVRQIAGPTARSMHDVMCVIETLEGEKLALRQRLQEMSAFALNLYDHLRGFPSSEMNSGLEAQHHAVLASPRSRESEAAAQTVIDELLQDKMRDERANYDAMVDSITTGHRETQARLEVKLREKDEAIANAEDTFQDLAASVDAARLETAFWHRVAQVALCTAVVTTLGVLAMAFF